MLRYLNLLHTGATLQAVSLVKVLMFSPPQKCPLFGNTSALATFSQFVTYQSDTASSIAYDNFYVFSTAEVSPVWDHLCSCCVFSICYSRVRHAHSTDKNAISPLHYEITFLSASLRITHFDNKKAGYLI